MLERLTRSWALLRTSAGILAATPQLLLFPVVALTTGLLVAVSFLGLLGGALPLAQLHPEWLDPTLAWVLPAAGLYLVQYSVIFFCNVALIGVVSARLDGGTASVAEGFRMAAARGGAILAYAALSATVGVALRAIQERTGWLGHWISGALGLGWTMSTFLVAPILIHRGIGPIDAMRESAGLLRRTWGENAAGQTGLGLVFGLAYVGIWIVTGSLAIMAFSADIGLAGLALLAAGALLTLTGAVIHAALQGIYAATLYRYATGQPGPDGFSDTLLARAFSARAPGPPSRLTLH